MAGEMQNCKEYGQLVQSEVADGRAGFAKQPQS